MAKEYNFQYTPLTGRLPGKSFVKQTEQAINELAGIVNEGSAQVEVITNLANTANANSEEALEKANEALETSGRVYITLQNLDDANDYYDSQLYYFANSYSANLPVEDTGFLEVKTNDTKTAAEQVFIADATGLMYMRHGVITSSEVGSETVYSVTWDIWSSALASEDYVQQEVNNEANRADSKFLPLSGGTMTGNLSINKSVPTIALKDVDIERGTNPASNYQSVGISMYDKNNKMFWGLLHDYKTNGENKVSLIAYNGKTTDYTFNGISVGYDGNGNAYTSAPTPANNDNSTKIATTAFVKNNYLPLSGGTMSGTIISGLNNTLKRSVNNGELCIFGGSGTGGSDPVIALRGKEKSSEAGTCFIRTVDANNSKTLMMKPDGTFTWGENNVITSALTGNVLSANGTSTTANAEITLCSISTHDAGVWLIIGFVDLSYGGHASFFGNQMVTANHGSRGVRTIPDGGGGSVNVLLTQLDANELVQLKGFQQESGTIRGSLTMVRLA